MAPALVTVLLLWPSAPIVRLVPLLIGVGGLYFLSDIVRGAGQAVEKRLDEKWQGLPAQRALRLSGHEKSLAAKRRRSTVQILLSRRLPSASMEAKDPDRAREAYDLAVRDLIPLVRGKGHDERLHEENTRYSFRRNMLAIRWHGVGVAVACISLDSVALWRGYERSEAVVAAAVAAVMLAIWCFVVRPSWVRQAGETYSSRFYDALQSLEAARRISE